MKNIKLIFIIALWVIFGKTIYAQNTECSGTSKVATQGSFTLGYNYSFTTNINGDVTFTCELLDAFTSPIAYAWTYNPSFAEVGMSASGKKYSKVFTGQLNGATFKVACKFAYAGGMSVTQTFTYTVGSNCGIIVGAPTLSATAPATSITPISAVSGGTVTSAGTSSITARGVCWNTITKPTADLVTKTTDGVGIGTFISNLTGLVPGFKYYVRAYATNNAGTNYGPEITFTAPDTEIPKNFTAKSGTALSTSIPLNLNAIDNSGSVTYTITYGTKPTVVTVTGTSGTETVYLIENLSPATDYSFTIAAKDATGNAAINSPLVVAAKTRPGVTPAPVPTKDIEMVVSIFSDSYNSIGGSLFNPMGEQNTVVTMPQISGNTSLKYSYFDSQETELGTDLNLTELAITNIHFDAWSEDETILKLHLLNRNPLSERKYEIPTLVKAEWNSYDIPITAFTNQSGFTPNSIYKLIMEGSGNSGATLKTVYIDNIYLWRISTAIQSIDKDNLIKCYPNPAHNQLTITSPTVINEIVIRNLVGQTVKTNEPNSMEKSIDLSGLASGNYFVIIRLENGKTLIKKMIKK